MTNATNAFNASRNSPHIKPIKRASRESYKDIVEGKASPTLWNPADTIWISKLKSFWSKNPTIDILSPVAVMEAQKTVTSDGAANRRIAEDFTNYQLSNGMQQESLKYGFRPALARLSQEVSNAFLDPALANAGLLASPKTATFTIDLNTLENLIDTWNRKVR